MHRTRFPAVLVLLLAAAPLAAAKPANAPPAGRGKFRGLNKAVRFDISRPLRELAQVQIVPSQTREFDEDREIPPVAPQGPQTPDAALQQATPTDLPAAMPAPLVSFAGPSNTLGVNPPDSVGDVGPNHYFAVKNTNFQIFDKTGTSLLGPSTINTLWSGFGGACQTRNDGDPIIVYDNLADRWVAGQFTAASPYYICLAVSQTPDPTGSWFRWAIPTQATGLPDYPKLGMMPDAYYISTREFTSGSAFYGIGAYALNRQQAIAGNPGATLISMIALASANAAYNLGDGLHPADLDGNILPPSGSPEYYLGHMDDGSTKGATQDAITLWKFAPNWTTPASSTFTLANTLPVAAVDTMFASCSSTRACIPQKSSTALVDHLGYRQRVTNRVAYRNFGDHESLVTSVSVEAVTNISGMRWYEIRSPNAAPTIYQQSTFYGGSLTPSDTHSRWMGSIAQDHLGDMGLGYSVSSAALDPSVRYTGRLVTDPLNSMPQGENSIVEGTGAQTTTNNRWGDYSSMNIDPDGCRFWYVNEYYPATATANWSLRIGAFRFPSCTDLPGLLRNSALAALNPAAAAKAAIFPRAGDPSLAATDKVFTGFDAGGYFPQEATDFPATTGPIVFYQLEGNSGNTLKVAKNSATQKIVITW